MGLFDFFKKNKKEEQNQLDKGLEKTKTGFFAKLTKLIIGKSTIDDDVLDQLEEILILSDVGVDTTIKIINKIRDRVAKEKYSTTAELDRILKEEIENLLYENQEKKYNFDIEPQTHNGKKVPYVIMVVGVNGVGKTTTIGKLSNRFKEAGYKVMIGAADTYRAAAVDQLKIWAERVGVPIVDKGMGADPASVAYETVKKAIQEEVDVVLVDTAGRLHNKINLMNELSKIKRVMSRDIPNAPHEVLLVLDASTGQNAIIQAQEFTKATEVSALALTKLDGTAKGGVVIGISDMFQIPVKYIGVGEGINDLQLFNPKTFVDTFFHQSKN
jgi:fused signal recognition particle receptor